MQTLKLKAYRLLNRFVPCDITQILLLNFQESRPPRGDTDDTEQFEGYTFRFFDAADIRKFSQTPNSELKANMAVMLDEQQAICFGIENQGELAGYVWAATGRVAAQHNSGGGRFKGIGLRLPQHMAYLFKGYVMPAHRGRNLNPWMLFQIGQALKARGYLHMICTTDWTNYAFQRSVDKIGFEKIGLEGEFIVGETHRYWCPNLRDYSISLLGGEENP